MTVKTAMPHGIQCGNKCISCVHFMCGASWVLSSALYREPELYFPFSTRPVTDWAVVITAAAGGGAGGPAAGPGPGAGGVSGRDAHRRPGERGPAGGAAAQGEGAADHRHQVHANERLID